MHLGYRRRQRARVRPIFPTGCLLYLAVGGYTKATHVMRDAHAHCSELC